MNTDRKLAAWEIASVTVSCLVAEWVVLAFGGDSKVLLAVPVVLALVLMIFSHRVYGENLHAIGFRLDNFLAALLPDHSRSQIQRFIKDGLVRGPAAL